MYGSFRSEAGRNLEIFRPDKSKGAFVLLVNLTFGRREGKSFLVLMKVFKHEIFVQVLKLFLNAQCINQIEKEDFAESFSKFVEYVATHEPRTISYELAQSDKVENELLIIERYVNKEAYKDFHRKSLEFTNFRAKLSKMDVTIEGRSYFETNIGFISNSLNNFHAGDMYWLRRT